MEIHRDLQAQNSDDKEVDAGTEYASDDARNQQAMDKKEGLEKLPVNMSAEFAAANNRGSFTGESRSVRVSC